MLDSRTHRKGKTLNSLRLCVLLLPFLIAGCLPGEQPSPVVPTAVATSPPTTETGPQSTPTFTSASLATTPGETARPVSTRAIRWLSTSPTPTLMPIAVRQRLFQRVWITVKIQYLYPDFNGLDWDSIRDEYKPRIESVSSSLEFYSLLGEMITRLDDEHSSFLTPWEAIEQDQWYDNTLDYIGIGILTGDDESAIIVTYVMPGGPAEEAGLQRRDRIIGVDGKFFKNPLNEEIRISGPEGTTVRLTVESPGREPREVVIPRRRITGSLRPMGHRLEVDNSIGYLIMPDFIADNMGELVASELGRLLLEGPLDGLILDLRENKGGGRAVLKSILGQFVSGRVGNFYARTRSYPMVIVEGRLKERLDPVPLIVLVDASTESYAE